MQGSHPNDYSPGMISGSWAVGQLGSILLPILDTRLAHLLLLLEVSASCLASNFLWGLALSFLELKNADTGR